MTRWVCFGHQPDQFGVAISGPDCLDRPRDDEPKLATVRNPGGGADRFDRIGRWTAIAGHSAQRDCFSGTAVESEQAWPRPVCAGYLAGNLTQRAPALLLPPEPVRAYLDRDSLAVPLTHQPRAWGERDGLTLRWGAVSLRPARSSSRTTVADSPSNQRSCRR